MTIIFVHGIFSSCAVFAPLKESIKRSCPDVQRALDFTYPYLESLESNALLLNQFMRERIGAGEEVAILAHSMGGLVSRMALLTDTSERVYRVRYLIMMATPNHGAIKMSQINGIADFVRRSVGKISPISSRSRGLDDLTRVNTIINDLFAAHVDAIAKTKGVDYITIPALKYNEDHPRDTQSPKPLNSRFLGFLATLSARHGSIGLSLPHDGIVEENSVRMVSADPLYQTERTFYSTPAGRKLVDRTCNLHIIHPDQRSANHVEIHSIARVCTLVTELLNCEGIDAWIGGMSEGERSVVNLSNGELI